MEKIKAEQGKLPPTPLLGRKVFLDPQEVSPIRSITSSLMRQTIYEQQVVDRELPRVMERQVHQQHPPQHQHQPPPPQHQQPSPSSVARRLGSTVANYTPVLNGSAYARTIEARTGGLVGVAAGLGMGVMGPGMSMAGTAASVSGPSPTVAVTPPQPELAKPSGPGQAAGLGAEGRAQRVLRKLAARQPQEPIEHLHEMVKPLLDRERERLERERDLQERPGGEVGVMAEVVLQDPPKTPPTPQTPVTGGRERLNSEARSVEIRISTGTAGGSAGSSRSELQAELHQPPSSSSGRHHRLERQVSNEQLVQARRDELPQELWRERAERERRLERQTSSEQEREAAPPQGHEARRRDRHRVDRQESSEREHSDRRST